MYCPCREGIENVDGNYGTTLIYFDDNIASKNIYRRPGPDVQGGAGGVAARLGGARPAAALVRQPAGLRHLLPLSTQTDDDRWAADTGVIG